MKIKKIKVMTVVGTRPEIIRLSEVLKALDKDTDHVLVHTGQNYDYELSEVFFKDLGLRKPDYFLEAVGKSASETVGTIIAKTDAVLKKESPEAFLVLGDTNSCMAAYAAKRRKIPVFHMEAGNRCFDMRVPEEINRRIIDHMSDINIVYSDLARLNLLREGLPMDRIIKSGSPMYEVLYKNREKINSSGILEELKLKAKDYFVFSAHREEHVDSENSFNSIMEIIDAISNTYNKPIVFSVHPRTRKRIEEKNITLPKNVIAMKPFSFFDYIKLQINSLCVLSDSGTISEESAILNFPAVNIRETHERPEATDMGSVVMSGLNVNRVLQSIELVKDQARGEKRDYIVPADYNVFNVSKKVSRTILSYTDYINRKIWNK